MLLERAEPSCNVRSSMVSGRRKIARLNLPRAAIAWRSSPRLSRDTVARARGFYVLARRYEMVLCVRTGIERFTHGNSVSSGKSTTFSADDI